MSGNMGGKRKNKNALLAPLSFIIICAALVFALSVFFRVSTIEVVGNSRYTNEEIIEASGIESGDNLFFINRFTAMSKLYAKLPYVERATINRSLPNQIVIEIAESEAVAFVQADDGIWAIDRSCKLLAKLDVQDSENLIEVRGLSALAPSVGDKISPGEEDSVKVPYLSDILWQITELQIQKDIEWIDMSNLANPEFEYLGRFKVKLGSNEDVDYKFQLLLSAVAALEDGDSGTLDLSVDKRAHLTYD